MPYSHDLKNEKKPSKRILLPEGSRGMTVTAVNYGTAKSGNPMFTFELTDNETKNVDKFYCIDVEGKRGNLKMILEACKVNPESWDNHDVIGKEVVCDIVHKQENFINREGKEVNFTKHKIAEITALDW